MSSFNKTTPTADQSASRSRSPSFKNDSVALNAPGRLRKDGMPDMRVKVNREYVLQAQMSVQLTSSTKSKPRVFNGSSTLNLASRNRLTAQLCAIDEQLEQTRLDHEEAKHYLEQREVFDAVTKERRKLDEEKLLLEDARQHLEQQKKLYEAEKEAQKKESNYLLELCTELEKIQLDVPVVSRDEIQRMTENFSTSLGNGGFGQVFKGNWNETAVAVKVLLPNLCRERYLAKVLERELDALAKVSHPCIVKLLGFCSNTKVTFPAPAIILSYANAGTLFQSIFKAGPTKIVLEPKVVLRIALDVALALEYLHSCSCSQGRVLVHRDIKSSNVLLHETNGTVRGILADFGLSRLSSMIDVEAAIGHQDSHTSVVGTQGYIDPVYAETFQVQPSMDIYAYGVLLMEVLWKERPEQMLARRVRQTNFDDSVKKAIKNYLGKQPSKYVRVIEELVGIAKECLVVEHIDQRPDAKEIKDRLKKLYSRN